MTSLDDDQRADLDRLRNEIAEEETRLAAAIGEYNATTRAAYEKLIGLTAGYVRSRDEFEHLLSEVASAMMETAGEAGDDWQQGEEGQGYLQRMNAWIEAASIPTSFERPRELTPPDPPFSAIIAALPLRAGDDKESAEARLTSSEAPVASAPGKSAAEMAAKRYFEFTDEKSSKFWEVSHQGSEMTTRWGKIGTGGQAKTKSFATPEKAAAETAKIIATKVKEGYVEQTGPARSSKSKAFTDWSESADPELMLRKVLPSASDRKRRLFAVACCRQVEDWLVVKSGLVLDMRVEDYQNAIDAAERFSDGKATDEEMRETFWNADDSAFCNEWLQDKTAEEMRKATYGNDPGWKDRMRPKMSAESWQELDALPDPATWFEDAVNAGRLPGGVDPFRDVAGQDAVLIGETAYRKVLLLVRHYGGEDRAAEERKAQAALVRDIFGDPLPPPKFDATWRTTDVTSLAESIYEDKAFNRMPILGDALEEAGCDDQVILDHCRGPGPHVRGCWVLDSVLVKE